LSLDLFLRKLSTNYTTEESLMYPTYTSLVVNVLFSITVKIIQASLMLRLMKESS
ncbi:hypothetical protein PIB30_111560, partial [Stylosanthes scabra]|nr:hypothetical protein [Stylosanthes scabra]